MDGSLLREPFVHFAVLGLTLFGLWELVGGDESESAPIQMVSVKAEEVDMLSLSFAERMGRDPSPEELAALVKDRTDEELLYLDGLANGLNRGDPVVRRRVIQKQRFLLEELNPVAEPTEAEVAARVADRPERYGKSEAVAFVQVFFDFERRKDAEEDARAEQIRLDAGAEAPPGGDPFALGSEFGLRSVDAHLRELGPAFAAVLAEAPVGAWSLASSRWGWHLVQVQQRVPAEELTQASVLEQARYELIQEARAAAVERGLEKLRERYRVEVEQR